MKQSYEHCDLLCLHLDTMITVCENLLTFFSKGKQRVETNIVGGVETESDSVHIVLNYIFLLHSPQPE